jgi:hypothetical protein
MKYSVIFMTVYAICEIALSKVTIKVA